MLTHLYATEAEARRVIAAIDAALGATEILRQPDGTLVEVPRKTWAVPLPRRDGTWAVAWKARLAPIEGRTVVVDGASVTVPLARDAVETTDADREAR